MTPLAAIGEQLRTRLGLDPATLGARALAHAVRARAAARGLDGVSAYRAALDDDPAEWEALVEAVVVPETWFFRDGEPFALLARWATREWAARSADDPISILSLPCASGEEAWSIAIALAAAGVAPAAFRVDARDVSARALATARTARYPARALRGRRLAPAWAHYLLSGARADGVFEVAPALRPSVQFARGNLLDARCEFSGRRFDCVFSRNLLIYCDEPTRAAAIATFAELLRPGGLLVLGHAETLPAGTTAFAREGSPGAFAWRRVAARRPPARRTAVARGHQPRVSEDARALADRGRLVEAAAAAALHIERAPEDASAHALLGIIRAAQGRDADATEHLKRALYLDPTHDDALVHLALICERRGDRAAAARLRQRARRAGVSQ